MQLEQQASAVGMESVSVFWRGVRHLLDTMPDTRPVRCRDHAFEFTRLEGPDTVSIVTEFHGNTFYGLQATLTSIVEHTPYDLYLEILVIDDGTTNPDISKACSVFISDPKFKKVGMFSNKYRATQ